MIMRCETVQLGDVPASSMQVDACSWVGMLKSPGSVFILLNIVVKFPERTETLTEIF